MIPKRISLKNFLTYGDPGAEFEFSADDPLWVLCGPNGIGKSAVFDAITYALYGEHRAGKQRAEQLVRHGANEFEIEFDFEFHGIDYRIRRTRPRKRGARPTQHLLMHSGGDWRFVRGNDPSGAVGDDDIKDWVVGTLGIGFEAFTNSVLLRQGEADKLFSASGDDRIAVLKGIIGFEQFEALYERVHTATAVHENAADRLWAQLSALPPVSEDEQAEAESTVKRLQAAQTAAHQALEAAVERVEQARQWDKLEEQRQELEGWLAEAEERAKAARRIREDKAALDDLTVTVPALQVLLDLRSRISELNANLDEAQSTLIQVTNDREANLKASDDIQQKVAQHQAEMERLDRLVKELADEIKRQGKLLTIADEVERLETELKEYPDDLDRQVADASAAEGKADSAVSEANEAKTRAETRLAQAVDSQREFTDVEVGATCSRCGQMVSEAHAAKERDRLAAEKRRWQSEYDQAEAIARDRAEELGAARALRDRLEKAKTGRNNLVVQVVAQRKSLSVLGEVASSAELRAAFDSRREQKAQAERARKQEERLHRDAVDGANRLNSELKGLDGKVKRVGNRVQDSKTKLASAEGEERTHLGQLSDRWRERLPGVDADTVARLASERARLITENVAERFRALEKDEVRRSEWEGRLDQIRADLDGIPPDARIPQPDAEKKRSTAKAEAAKADAERDSAVKHRDELENRRRECDRVTTDHREAAEKHRLHKELDRLLGRTGLQLKLVRDAEDQIVAFANETLQHLTDGDLTLEEDPDVGSKRAFDLRVRRAGGEPIGVAFLSDSQRFRVAVSVALAVGRFASGRARPLEAVIIDEGFGGLDRDGLRTMAEELKRLQRTDALRRVILVSHQTEFTDYFPVGYSLAPGEAGTIASLFRR